MMFEIRECTGEDFEEIVRLLRQLWPSKKLDPSNLRAAFERGLRSDTQKYLCARNGDGIVGFCSLTLKNSLWQEGYLAHIDELVIDERRRGLGIGLSLLHRLIETAGELGCSRIELDSAFERTDAHRFYEREGFENRAFLFSRSL